jgi:hypothetical protein
MTTKQQQFITTVQTAMIVTYSSGYYDDKHDIGPMSNVLSGMDDAFHAAQNIPSDMTASEAACEFMEFWRSAPEDSRKYLKAWFARY